VNDHSRHQVAATEYEHPVLSIPGEAIRLVQSMISWWHNNREIIKRKKDVADFSAAWRQWQTVVSGTKNALLKLACLQYTVLHDSQHPFIDVLRVGAFKLVCSKEHIWYPDWPPNYFGFCFKISRIFELRKFRGNGRLRIVSFTNVVNTRRVIPRI
jgi:hypothetical protein